MVSLLCWSLTPRVATRSSRRSRILYASAAEEAWSAAEDAALLDDTPAFTVGDAGSTVTFWSALAVATPALARRTPLECEERIILLAAADGSVSSSPLNPDGGDARGALRYGRRPAVLDDWERMDDGRVVGTLEGQVVWLTPALEGCLASDPRPGPGYVQAVGGRILALGRPRLPASTAALSVAPWSPPANDRLSDMATQIGATLLVTAAGLGFFFGANIGPDLPLARPPPGRSSGVATVAAAPAFERASLMTGEQLARQQLRLEADRLDLRKLDEALQRDGLVVDGGTLRREKLQLKIRQDPNARTLTLTLTLTLALALTLTLTLTPTLTLTLTRTRRACVRSRGSWPNEGQALGRCRSASFRRATSG